MRILKFVYYNIRHSFKKIIYILPLFLYTTHTETHTVKKNLAYEWNFSQTTP